MSKGGRGKAPKSAASHVHKPSRFNRNNNMMDDFHTRTNGTDNRPLFEEITGRDRIVNLTVGGLTSVFVLVTVISSFVFPTPPPTSLNIFFVLCIIMICSSILVLIFWYRQGDLDPKFCGLIYYSIGSLFLLCLCANLYFHDVGR